MAQDPRFGNPGFGSPMNGGPTPPGAPGSLNISSTPTTRAAPAGFWIRFVAAFVDGIILGIVQSPITIAGLVITPMIAAAAPDMAHLASVLNILLFLPLTWGVIPFFWFGWWYKNKGATPGKMLMGLKVMHSETGQHLTYWRAWAREIPGKLVSSAPFLLGFIVAGFRGDKKALHDLLFATQVIRTK